MSETKAYFPPGRHNCEDYRNLSQLVSKTTMKTRVILSLVLLMWGGRTLTSGKTDVNVDPSGGHVVRKNTYTASGNIFNLTDFGAVGDGATDAGPALQSALDAMGEAGGGTLFVPAGRYAIVTPVQKNFTGLASDISILGVESLTPVPPPNAGGDELTRGLDLQSEFAPRTGENAVAITITGLQSFLIKDITFIGTPDVDTDAWITLSLADVREATIKHCEFYGLSSVEDGGAILQGVRSGLEVSQSVFLGSTCSSGYYSSVVQNIEWKKVTIADTVFADFGQRAELYGKLHIVPPFSWIGIGNAAAVQPDSPRREAVIRNVFLDEGGFSGLSSLPYRYQPVSAPIDLIYVSRLYMNVSNLGFSGNYLYGPQRVLIEDSHYGWSHNADSAINLLGAGNAILDRVECSASANRIRADAATGKLTVINSVYAFLDSESPLTRVVTTETPEEDPVQYVREQFNATLSRDPDAASHFYWSDQFLQCLDDSNCIDARRVDLQNYLGAVPQEKFAVSGQIVDENGEAMSGVNVGLEGSQNVTTVTGADGRYQFSNLPTSGVYRIVPSRSHYTFNPVSSEIVTPAADQTFNSAGSFNHHVIAGQVSDGTGNPMSDVIVSLSGSENMTTTTGLDGRYSFTDLPAGGNYIVTPRKTSYGFSPANVTLNDLGADENRNFAGTFVTYNVGGIVVGINNNAMPGVTVTLSGSEDRTTITDSTGHFSFAGLPSEGNYTVTLKLIEYSFNPASLTYNALAANKVQTYVGIFTTHAITGHVTHSGNAPLSGALVTLSGYKAGTTTTDANGNYSFPALPRGGDYTLTVSKTHYTFSAPSRTFNNLTSNQTADFDSTRILHSISGRVTVGQSSMSGVVVTLSGSQVGMATTDMDGNYSFTVFAGGDYTLTPSKTHYSFTPPTRTFTDLSGNQTSNFIATLNVHSLSGRVTEGQTSLSGVTVSLSGTQSGTTITDAGGNYSFTTFAGGDYALTVSKTHYTFVPPTRTFTDLSGNQTADFIATRNVHSISGHVTVGQTSLSGVTVTLSGTQSGTTVTDAGGNYSFTAFEGGTYTVTPAKKDYLFSPTSKNFTDLGNNQNADFDATLQTVLEFSATNYSVSETTRRITVTVTREGDTSGASELVYSAADGTADQRSDAIPVIGRLSFAPNETSKTFFIFITDDSYVEGDESMTLELGDLVGGVLGSNNTATLTITDNDSSGSAPNPIDDAQFFVRQQYRDFLNRSADSQGLAFWSNQILSCGSDAACISDRRTNVSAAFFLSIEFQETGFLVYRLYQAAYSLPPQHLDEFLLDTRTIGEGVIVNSAGWQELLEANKTAVIESFVARTGFTEVYPLSLTPAEFVDRLNTRVGGVLSQADVAAAVAEFEGAATSESVSARARALRRVAENGTFSQRELNRAFVLMQYFGYLQRNPSDPPNTNLDGYNFWLHKLEEFGGDFRRAEMVKSFLVSTEYRSRFGAP